jgi:hypothetical protein
MWNISGPCYHLLVISNKRTENKKFVLLMLLVKGMVVTIREPPLRKSWEYSNIT